jgi:hypothetical protein
MDRGQFDALARLVSTKKSRRTALAAVLGAALLGHDPDAAAARARARRRGRGRMRAQATVETCYPGTRCTPGKGRNNSGCDFSGTTIFQNRNVRGANLSNSNFTGADLAGADFRGANLSGACFVDANLTGARLGASVNLDNAVFCGTFMPDGSFNNDDCERPTACCPTKCSDGGCPPGGCNVWGGYCGNVAGPCCDGLTCLNPPLSRCQKLCETTEECRQFRPNRPDILCLVNTIECAGLKCCQD